MQLTVGEMNAESPVASRDGKKVFFIGSTRRGELVRYDQKRRAFVPYLSGLSADGVTFTRDGQRVAYISYPEGNLWQSRTDGSDRHELTFSPIEASLPRWSPDGSQIAFTAHEPGKTWQIYIVPAEGGKPDQLTSGDHDNLDPTWSPDGNSLAFGWNNFDVRDSQENAIHILDLKTRRVTALPDSVRLFSPRWSPDGRYLVAVRVDYTKLILYDFAEQKWADLVKMPGGWQNWSPDGKCIYFVQPADKTQPVYRICLNDRKLEHIGNVSDAGKLALGPFGWWTGLSPDDGILATRDISIEEVYALDVKFP
jgi:Tol biopolymer transport system component